MKDSTVSLILLAIITTICALTYYLWYDWDNLRVRYIPVDYVAPCVAEGNSQVICEIRATAYPARYNMRKGPQK